MPSAWASTLRILSGAPHPVTEAESVGGPHCGPGSYVHLLTGHLIQSSPRLRELSTVAAFILQTSKVGRRALLTYSTSASE